MPRSHAFTYVELTLVLTIICILAAIAVPNFLEARTRSVVSRSRADQNQLKLAVEAYRLENRCYPQNRTPAQYTPGDLTCLTTPVVFIAQVPWDPFTLAENIDERAPRGDLREGFHYINGLQFRPDEGLRVQEEFGQPWPGMVAILVWGYGPAHYLRDAGKAPAPVTVKLNGAVTLTTYDPTNGTTSPGVNALRMP
jgi:type II secretory pathway pseudopilin PulG